MRRCPRVSCVAQRETFNSVTSGLNYHAETIVPGKIKKGTQRRLDDGCPGDISSSSRKHVQQSPYAKKSRKSEYSIGDERKRRGQRQNSFFRLDDLFVVLGLAHLMDKERREGIRKQRRSRIERKSEKRNRSTKKDEENIDVCPVKQQRAAENSR